MIETKKNELANTLKKVKHFCKKLDFTNEMLNGALIKGLSERC
tara:strand:+ start:394 stop:522 length:129 start_codon:yes stop_codon:yes gene_type:complete